MYSSAPTEPQKYWLYTRWLNERSDLHPKKMIRCRLPCGKTDMRQFTDRTEKRDDLRPKAEDKLVRISSNAALLQQNRKSQEWSRVLGQAVKHPTAKSDQIVAYSKTIVKLGRAADT
jgi:hypothetical protein